jgi:hypothetical protein
MGGKIQIIVFWVYIVYIIHKNQTNIFYDLGKIFQHSPGRPVIFFKEKYILLGGILVSQLKVHKKII